MLKKIRETLEGLDEKLHDLYVKQDDGKFHLKLEDDDAGPLRRAKEHEVGLRQIAEQERDQARAELATSRERIAELERTQSSTTQELRADHDRAMAALRAEHSREKEGLEATIKRIFVTDVAGKLAGEIAIDEGAAELLSENMARRLSVEMVNGNPVTRVLSADGKASNMTPDELKAEYLQNTRYAGILRASDASGGGASGGGSGGGASGKKLADLSEAERRTMAKEDPIGFQRLVDAAKAEQE